MKTLILIVVSLFLGALGMLLGLIKACFMWKQDGHPGGVAIWIFVAVLGYVALKPLLKQMLDIIRFPEDPKEPYLSKLVADSYSIQRGHPPHIEWLTPEGEWLPNIFEAARFEKYDKHKAEACISKLRKELT